MNDDSKKDHIFKIMHRSLIARMRDYFLAGLLVTAPIGITIYLTYIFLNFVDSKVRYLFKLEYSPQAAIPGIGILIAVSFFILVGWFARNFLGRMLIRISEYIVDRMPVIRTVYAALKQIFETIMASQSQAFRDVVMLEYPRKGVWSIGFVTGVSEGEVQRMTAEETINVFVPTTPNPTSGYLLFVPRKELFFLEMSVEEAVKLVVSGGIITPPDRSLIKEGTEGKAANRNAAAKARPAKEKPAKEKPSAKAKAKSFSKK